MSAVEVTRQRQRLDALFLKARDLQDPELQAHWSRYLCVLVSGFLETAVRLTYSQYVRHRSAPEVAQFAESRLQQFQNPKMGAILDLVGSFSQIWKDEIKAAGEGQISDSVNSIVANRHKIAHGESVGISMGVLSQYYRDANKLVALMQSQCER